MKSRPLILPLSLCTWCVSSFLDVFKIAPLSLAFNNLSMAWLGAISLCLSFLEFIEILEFVKYYFTPRLNHSFFKMIFFPCHLSLSSFPWFQLHICWANSYFPYVSDVLLISVLTLVSFLVRLDNFYWSIDQFTNSSAISKGMLQPPMKFLLQYLTF